MISRFADSGIALKVLFTLVVLVALAACGSNKPKKVNTDPVKLQDYDKRVKLVKEWSRSIGNGQGKDDDRLTLGVSAQGVCAASVNGRVRCLDHNGNTQWKARIAERLSAGVGVSKTMALVSDSDGNIKALSRQDGELLWQQNYSTQILAAPQSDDSTVIVQTTDGRLLALEAETGEKRWEYIADEPRLTLKGTATPVINNQIVYTGFSNGKIVALDIDNGALLFDSAVAIATGTSEIDRLVDVDSSPLINGNSLYAVSYNGNLFSFDLRSGRPQWRYDTSSYRELAAGINKIYLVDDTSQLLALDDDTGYERWLQDQLRYRQLGAATVFSGYIVIADYKGYLHVISQVDGTIVGRTRTDRAAVNVPMRRHSDLLYVYSDDGKLTAYRLEVLDR
jgi:outer membrane protein assembly factor BamB